jgi:hypothetical protein
MARNFGCTYPGCEKHPSKGDTIYRISPKPGPFVGRCKEHSNVDQDLIVLAETVKEEIEKGNIKFDRGIGYEG